MWDGPTCVAFGHISCKVCTYDLQIPTLSFLFFFSKKKKILRMQEVVYKVIRCTYLLQWAIVWWLTLVKQNRPFTKWLFLQIGLSENLLKVCSKRKSKYLEFRRIRRHLLVIFYWWARELKSWATFMMTGFYNNSFYENVHNL